MKAFGVFLFLLLTALVCVSGCGGSSSPGMPIAAAPPGQPPSSSSPTSGPTGAPSALPCTKAATSFTPGDWYNQSIATAAVDANSANYITSAAAADSGGFYFRASA